ncbi:MAG: hypothetical protein LBJ64_01415, partial [Deltaproteobacteria bacterium]|nr:hypothetical protein [Deltaproteobacteria bacterium]
NRRLEGALKATAEKKPWPISASKTAWPKTKGASGGHGRRRERPWGIGLADSSPTTGQKKPARSRRLKMFQDAKRHDQTLRRINN